MPTRIYGLITSIFISLATIILLLFNNNIAHANTDLTLGFDPVVSTIPTIGNNTVISVTLTNIITPVTGIEFDITFDPTKLQVVDADLSTSGTQIDVDNCLNNQTTLQNITDNTIGLIQYSAVTTMTGCTNITEVVANIEFSCLTENIITPLDITDSLIFDTDVLTHTLQSSLVQCGGFSWGSFNGNQNTAYGVYDSDSTTPLKTNDLIQLIDVGANGVIDPPSCSGQPGNDDILMDTTSIGLNDQGYIPLQMLIPDANQLGKTVYMRAWNHSFLPNSTHYGNSQSTTLVNGGRFNALSWSTNIPVSLVGVANWTGATNNDWHNPTNWAESCVPTKDIVTILDANSTTTLSTKANSRFVLIQDGSTLDLNQFELTVEDELINNGIIKQTKPAPANTQTRFGFVDNQLGTERKYYGVDILPVSDMGEVRVTIYGNGTSSNCATNPTDPIMDRCYKIEPTNPVLANITYWFTENERNGVNATNSRVWVYDSPPANWLQVGNHPSDYIYSESNQYCTSGAGEACHIQITNIDTFSHFALGDSAPTCQSEPATAVTPQISYNDINVILTWSDISSNTGGYEIHYHDTTPYFTVETNTLLAGTDVGTTTYTDGNTPNHRFYIVRALNCNRNQYADSQQLGQFTYALTSGQ
ncbi:MAG TPA: cohesin domain-containing protein [Anaerolineae bacterium]|nr:cohesin domain-containing protein [Anaerolineae bacterium]